IADEIKADILEHGVDSRGVFTQRYGDEALDASLLLVVLTRFLPPDDPRVRNTVLAIADELTEFAFAESGTAWWKPAYLWNREEYLDNKTPLDAVGTAQTVMTIKLASGTHVAVHEA
ncbi:glycoside hydrolase family 97 N-terminal domain-containing protein, partial [Escherichia coli]|nr:glycoside hydrolase family 97 N-terminal domain-containing protein [Escherichia coli]